MKLRAILAMVLMTLIDLNARGQEMSVKTNLLGDGFLNPNMAVEMGVAPKWTVEVSGQFNLWKLSHDRQWRHWAVQSEARYWFCDRFSGQFVGAHLLGGQYNIGGINLPFSFLGTDFGKLKDTRFQGWYAGAAISYGYAWPISERWNIEAVIGLGWTYTRYDQFRCKGCGKKEKTHVPHNYVGPTKIAVNLEYVF